MSDPAYLTEPFIRTTNWVLDPRHRLLLIRVRRWSKWTGPKGSVPHHLPGTNAYVDDFAKRFSLPEAAARGGAETMYPEYEQKMKVGK